MCLLKEYEKLLIVLNIEPFKLIKTKFYIKLEFRKSDLSDNSYALNM